MVGVDVAVDAADLWGRLDLPNVMIKVPATEAGLEAIEELTFRGVNVNVWDVTDTIQRLIRSRRPADIARLTDPDVPLEELAPTPAS